MDEQLAEAYGTLNGIILTLGGRGARRLVAWLAWSGIAGGADHGDGPSRQLQYLCAELQDCHHIDLLNL
jgi:hypothetical protein